MPKPFFDVLSPGSCLAYGIYTGRAGRHLWNRSKYRSLLRRCQDCAVAYGDFGPVTALEAICVYRVYLRLPGSSCYFLLFVI